MGKFSNVVNQAREGRAIDPASIERERLARSAQALPTEPVAEVETAEVEVEQPVARQQPAPNVVPTEITQDIARGDLEAEAAQTAEERGVQFFDPQTAEPQFFSPEAAEEATTQELARQEAQGERAIDYGAGFSDLRTQLKQQGYSQDSVDNVIETGRR